MKKNNIIVMLLIIFVFFSVKSIVLFYQPSIAAEFKEIEVLVEGKRVLPEVKVFNSEDSLYVPYQIIDEKIGLSKRSELLNKEIKVKEDKKYISVEGLEKKLDKEIIWDKELYVLGIGCDPGKEFSKLPFDINDIAAAEVSIGMKSEEVLDYIGKPDNKDEFLYRFGEGEIWSYDFGELVFYYWEDKLIINDIIINKPEIRGPRNIQVGDTKDKIISSFYKDDSNAKTSSLSKSQTSSTKIKTLYGESMHNTTGGTVYYREDGSVDRIIYVATDEGKWPYGLIIDFDEQNRVSSFTLRVEVI